MSSGPYYSTLYVGTLGSTGVPVTTLDATTISATNVYCTQLGDTGAVGHAAQVNQAYVTTLGSAGYPVGTMWGQTGTWINPDVGGAQKVYVNRQQGLSTDAAIYTYDTSVPNYEAGLCTAEAAVVAKNGVYNAYICPAGTGPAAQFLDGVLSTSNTCNLCDGTNAITATGPVVITGNISATNLSGTNTGDQTTVSGSSGSCTGNAGTATKLQTPRAINGTNFDGTMAITVTAAAGTLTGTALSSTVVTANLTDIETSTAAFYINKTSTGIIHLGDGGGTVRTGTASSGTLNALSLNVNIGSQGSGGNVNVNADTITLGVSGAGGTLNLNADTIQFAGPVYLTKFAAASTATANIQLGTTYVQLTGRTNGYGWPSGTLVSPPAGLNVGDLWLDTTTSSQYPIIRMRAT